MGTSGSGKSSLVRAGLIPALREGLLPGTGPHWRVAIFRPGGAPIGELARALTETKGRQGGEDAAAFVTLLLEGSRSTWC